jgi:hypothetical protein
MDADLHQQISFKAYQRLASTTAFIANLRFDGSFIDTPALRQHFPPDDLRR